MKIDVYDSYAQRADGGQMHFDVFVESGASADLALSYGRAWLASIGESGDSLNQSRCNFCHTESANPAVQTMVLQQGFFILQMEGCPEPING